MSLSTSSNDRVAIVPWIGPTTCKNSLSIVVLSSCPKIIENVSEALTEVHNKGCYSWKLIVLRSFNLESLLQQVHITGKIAIDFIVIAMDTSNVLCLEFTKNIIKQVHPDLRCRRLVLVNAGKLPPNSMAVSAGELISLSSEADIDLLSANVYIKEEALFLARRLLKYIEVTMGVKTGIPNINV